MEARRNQLKCGAALGALALMLMTAGADANPLDGTVSAGAATISSSQPGKLTVDQTTKIVIIDWKSFNIGKGETTTFNQPGADATAVNRIGGADPAKILGALNANGKVILIDGNGILFGKNAQVNVGGLLATTSDASNADLMSGKATFDKPGNPNARIVNKGSITATSGMVGLVAPSVVNNGTIVARLGQVTLGASNVFTVDFTGDGLISFPADPSILADAIDSHGKPVKALVANNGRIEGQTVLLSARAAAALITNVISIKGEVVARGIGEKGGHIILDGGQGSVSLVGAKLDATGARGGGDISIGSANAASVTVDAASTLDVSATAGGDGGHIYVNSANTAFHGTAKATGGTTSGNGGQIETSGETLAIDDAAIDTSAANGTTGTWLLDPRDVTISTGATSGGAIASNVFTPTANSSVLNAATLTAALANNDVVVSTGSTGTQNGDITISTALTWSSSHTLTLNANRNININSSITAASGGLYLYAGNLRADTVNGGTLGTIGIISDASAAISVDTFTLGQGNWTQLGASLPNFFARTFQVDQNGANAAIGANFYSWSVLSTSGGITFGSGSFIRATGGNGTTASPYQIADIYGLQGIAFSQNTVNSANANYKLVADIDASNLRDFRSIGDDSSPDNFTGTLDGQNFTISGLTASGSQTGMAGLFGWAFSGTVKNLKLANMAFGGANALQAGVIAQSTGGTVSNVTVTGGSVQATTAVGGLIGQMASGAVSNSSSSAAVITVGTANLSSQTIAAGGLVGQMSGGTVTQSYATGSVGGRRSAGGLVGYLGAGTISQSYAIGAVSLSLTNASIGTTFSAGAGGFAGVVQNGASITQSYALGSVTVSSANSVSLPIASFVGANGGSINEAYGAGDVAVTSGTVTLGGFAGAPSALTIGVAKAGTVTNTYYDNLTTGQTVQAGGLSTTALQGALPTSFNTLASGIWATGAGLYPYLAGFGAPQTVSGIAYKDTGTVLDASSNLGVVPVSLTIGGVSKGSVNAGANGYYYFQLPAATISGGATLIATTAANAVTGAVNGVGTITASASVSGLDIKLANTIAGTVFSDYGATALGSANVKEVMLTGGAVIATATSNATSGAYSLNAPVSNGKVLLFLDNSSGKFADTIVDYTGSTINGANLYAGYLNFYNTSAVSVSSVLSQLSSFAAPTGGFSTSDFLFSGATPSAGLAISSTSAAGFVVDTTINYTGTNSLAVKTTAGDLYVSNAITLANGTLTLDSFHDLNIGANLTISGTGKAVLATNDGGTGGDYTFFNGKSLQFTGTANTGQALTINAVAYTLMYSMTDVQNINTNLSGKYALAKSSDATSVSTWTPLGPLSSADINDNGMFVGTFEGLGNSISNLKVTSSLNFTGFVSTLGAAGVIRDFGLVGGSVTQSGSGAAGALVGLNRGTILKSWSSAAVTAGVYAGGLVGRGSSGISLISDSYATGTVTAGGNAGGLLGLGVGTILNSYATGNVSGGAGNAGGLVGSANTMTLTNVFSTGTVSGTGSKGGLAGTSSGATATNAYWNTQTSGLSTSAVGTPMTTAQLQAGPTGLNATPWIASSSANPVLNWQTTMVLPTPLLPPATISGTVYSDLGITALGNANVKEVFVTGGAVIASAISNATTGAYSLSAPSSSGKLLLFLDNSNGKFANTIADFAGANLTGVNLYAGYLSYYNSSAVSVSAALSQLSSFTAPTGGFAAGDFLFTVSGGAVTPTAGLNIVTSSTSGFAIDQALTLTALNVKLTGSGDIAVNSAVTVGDGALTLDSFRTVQIEAPITVTGKSKVTLTSNDGGSGGGVNFGILSLGSAGKLSFTGTEGAGQSLTINGTAYNLIYTAAELQALNSTNTTALAQTYAAARTIDLSSIANFVSIGSLTIGSGFGAPLATFNGTFDGLNNTVTGLTQVDPVTYGGLFARTSAATLRNINLANVSITVTGTGAVPTYVGGLVANANNNGSGTGTSLSNATVSGTFTLNSAHSQMLAGGAAGLLELTGTGTYLAASVNITDTATDVAQTKNLGGLIGSNSGTVTRSYATGAVTGVNTVGGFVGLSDGTITQSYATGAVSLFNPAATAGNGNTINGSLALFAGGFVGVTGARGTGPGLITQSYATGSVSVNAGSSRPGTLIVTTAAGGFAGSETRRFAGDSINGGTLNEVYATGSVSGATQNGGLVGANTSTAAGAIAGTITNSYWDTQTTGQTRVSGDAGAFTTGGLTTAQLQGTLPAGFNTLGSVWAAGAGLYPYFGWRYPVTPQKVSGIAYKDSGATIPDASSGLGAVPVSLTIGGVSQGAVNTGANGYYYFLLPPGTIAGGATVVTTTVANTTTGAVAATASTTASASVSGLNLIPAAPAKQISGTVYSDYGITALGNATVVETLVSGGGAIATATSNATTGTYALNAPQANGTLLLFLDNSNGRLANTVVSFAGSDMTGVNLYGGYLSFFNTSAVTVSSALSQLSGFSKPAAYGASDFLFSGTTPTAGLAISGTGGLALDTVLNLGSNTLVLNMGAAVTQSAALTAGKLLLLGASASYTLGGSNTIGTIAANTGAVSVTDGGALTVGTVEGTAGVTSGGAVTLSAIGNLTIASGAKVTSGANTNVVLSATGAFINNRGSDAVSTGAGGRWLIYSAAPSGDTFGSLNSANTAVWNTAAGGNVSVTGNRYVFAIQPLLTVTTGNLSKVYGSAVAVTGDFTITGFNTGVANAYLADTATTAFTGTPTLSSLGSGATATVASGPYAVTATQGTLAGLNGYGFSFVNTGTLTVTPKALIVALTGNVTKVYDGSTAATLVAGNYSLAGIVNGDAVALNSPVTGSYANANAATGKIVTVTSLALTGAGAGNYSIVTSVSGAVGVITPKALTATLTGGITKTYDGSTAATLAASNYALTGVVGSDAVSLASLPTTGTYISKDVATGLSVTSAAGITLTGAGASNYTVAATASGAIGQITQKALTVALAATPVTKTYDTNLNATLSAANFTLAGLVGTDTVAVATTTGTYDTKNVGAGKTINVGGITLGGAQANDYFLPTANVSGAVGIITAAALTPILSGTVVEKVFDNTITATVPAANLGLTGILGSDAVNLTSGAASYDTVNVGAGKTVTVAGLGLAGNDRGNYVLAANSVSGTVGKIDAASLIVIVGQLTGTVEKTYDGTTTATLNATNYLIQGLAPGAANVQLNNPTTGSYDTANAGSGKTVTVTGLAIAGGADAANYTLPVTTITGAVGIIDKAALTPGFNGNVTKIYDGTTAASVTAANVKLTGIVGTDDVVLGTVSGFYDTKDAGTTKTLTINGLQLTGAAAANYVLSSNSLAGTAGVITPKTVTASLTGAVEKTYDGGTAATVSLANLSLTGVISSDAAGLAAPTGASFDTKDAGTGKTVTATGLTLIGAQAGNYSLATSVAAAVGIIDPKAVTASLVGTPSKIYDGTTTASLTAANFTLNGKVGGDDAGIAAVTGSYDTANAGTAKTISVSGLVLGGATAGNYILTGNAVSGAVGVISPKSLTYNVANATSTFGTPATPGTATLTGVLAADAANVSGTVGIFDNASNAVTLSATTNAGSYAEKVTALTGGAAGSYVIAGSGNTNGTLVIAPLAVGPASVSYGVADANSIYGTLATLGAVTLTGVLAQDAANVRGTVSLFDINNLQQTLSATLSAGRYSEQVTALSGSAAANYVLATTANTAGTLTIAPKTLTIALTGAVSKAYNGTTAAALQANNYGLSGIVGTDNVALNNPAAGSFDTADAGTGKTVTVTGLVLSGAQASNYVLGATAISGAIGAITPATLTAILTGAASKTYDGNAGAALAAGNYLLNGVIGIDDVALNNPAAGSFDTADAGTGKTVTATGLVLSGAKAADYVLNGTTVAGAIGIITPKALTVALTGTVSKTYDGGTAATLAATNYGLAGIVGIDAVALNNPTDASFDTANAGTGKTITVNGLALTGGAANNYSLNTTSVSGTIGTVTPAILTAALTSTVSKTYDGSTSATLAASNYTLSGIVGTDAVALNNPTSGSFDTANAGTGKTVTVTGLALSGAASGNYSLAGTSISGAIGAITQKALTASLTGAVSKTYDGSTSATLAATNYSLSGIVGTDAVSLNNPVSGSFDTANAGAGKTVTVTGLALSGAASGNYSLAGTSISGAIGAITQKALTASLTGAVSKTYDGSTSATLAATNYSLSGIVGTDAVSLNNPVSGSFDTANAGAGKTVTVTGLALSGAASGNYSLASSVSGAVGTISQKSLTVSLTGGISKTYDATTGATLSTSNYSLAGVVAGDSITIANTSGSFGDANVGAGKTVTVTGLTLAGGASGNYVLAATTAFGSIGAITPAALTVRANDVSRIEGTPNPGFTITLTGLKGSDSAAVLTGVTASTTADIGSVVGSYAITSGGGIATNYVIGTRINGTLSVMARAANPDVAGLNNSLPASNTNYNSNAVPGSLDGLTTDKGSASVTGASGSLVCDVANNDASAEACHASGGQASIAAPRRTGDAHLAHNRAASLPGHKKRA